MVHQLYKASMEGCTLTLDSLIQADPLLLHRVSLNSFSETPLRISSLLGHHDFTLALLLNNRKLVSELDSLGQSPLHLASANGHVEIVKALLNVDTNVCMVCDRDDRIPLHLAAMRGRVEELIKAWPESVVVKLEEETVLHLCIRYNQLEVLEKILNLCRDNNELFGSKDHDGNTALHLAVSYCQLKMTRCLVTVARVEATKNEVNKKGFTALDILDQHRPKLNDFKIFQIGDILEAAGVIRRFRENQKTGVSQFSHEIIQMNPEEQLGAQPVSPPRISQVNPAAQQLGALAKSPTPSEIDRGVVWLE